MLELGGIVILGVLAQWIAWRLKVPAILPLIIIGLLVGPLSILISGHDAKWISPIWDGKHGLFPGEGLFHFVELAIGIILFEGGMTLKKEEIRGVGDTIGKLISVGAIITFAAAGLLAHFVVGLNWSISFLFAALIIVTGPTVIAPILRNVPLNRNVSTVLKWEGILIDPIGALAAVLVYEFISASGHGADSFTVEKLIQFFQIVFVSLSMGTLGALALREMLKREWIPHYLLTIYTLGFVLILFIGSSYLVHDSGLLTAVVAGMVLGNVDVPYIKDITYFKESLSILLISILFILLSANINLSDLELLNNWKIISLFLLVILFIRPLAVFLSTINSSLTTNEKLFISWMGPRGIVAAGIASLFGLKLFNEGFPDAEYITPLVFMVVLGTVLLNATTARLVANLLGVSLQVSNGIVIMGASRASRLIAKYLHDNNRHVVLVDSNKINVNHSEEMGLKAIHADLYNDEIAQNLELNDVGYLLSMTGNGDVNDYAIKKYRSSLGENGAFRLVTSDEMKNPDSVPNNGLFSTHDDYINLSEIARDMPDINEFEVGEDVDGNEILSQIDDSKFSIPLFVKRTDGEFDLILAKRDELTVSSGDTIVYLGHDITSE